MQIAEIIVNWLHMLAAFTWVGGLIFVNVVLTPAVAPKGLPPEFVRIMGMERFRFYAFGSIVVVALTGAFNTWRGLVHSSGPNVLFIGAFGLKLTMVAGMIAVTVLNAVVLRRRLTAAKPAPGGPSPEVQRIGNRLVLLSRVNLVLGSLVLLAVAVMRGAVR